MLRRDDNRRPGRFAISCALKARLAATESALAAAKSEREEAAKRLETAKAKHRDLLNSQVVYSRLAGTRSIETRPASSRADYVLVPAQRGFAPADRRSGEGAVSVRRGPLYEREMPLHRLNQGSDYDAAVALNGPLPQADHSVQRLRKHYWEVVDRETAERYWAIRP
jgi:hypothetical protein